jgi:hypothetical protein
MKYEIHFYRYGLKGKFHVVFPVPQEYINKYPDHTKETIKYHNFYGARPEGHISSALIEDNDFSAELRAFVRNSPDLNYDRFRDSYNYECSNFFFKFVDTETKRTYTRKPVDPNAPVVRRTRKPKREIDPENLEFPQLKERTKKRIEFIKKMHNIKDPIPLRNSNESTLKIAKDIFTSYKQLFEGSLNSKGIKFYVFNERFDKPDGAETTAKIFTEYILVNNIHDANMKSMNKQSWAKITLCWYSSLDRVESSRWNKYYLLSSKRIGISSSSASGTYPKDVKMLKGMKENVFFGIVNKAYENNNNTYLKNEEHFKNLPKKLEENKAEEIRVKDYLSQNLIPLVPTDFIKNINCNFDEGGFAIEFRGNSNRVKLIDIRRDTDSWDTITFYVSLFNSTSKKVANLSEMIQYIDNVFNNNLSVIINTYKRASEI